ncbi:MAG: type II secretion system F family protein [Lachnospiraceae bacterium]|nr:type II secretion system F family protein [Lachnospiraceae bacterium]
MKSEKKKKEKIVQKGKMKDYDFYHFSIKEIILFFIEGIGKIALYAYIFYRSILAFILLIPYLILYFKEKRRKCIRKQKENLSVQFKELMGAVNAGLAAGYSVENAFLHARDDLAMVFGKKADITKEMNVIAAGLKNNKNLEDLLSDFGARSHVEDIRDFAEVFNVAKRSGGSLPKVLSNCADVIGGKMDVKRRISTLISAKQFEQSIMNLVPFGIILYIGFTSPGFFDVLYGNMTGIAIMTILFAIYIVALKLADKIIRIRI